MMNLFLGLPILGLIIFLGIIALFIWIWALIDCIKSDSSGEYKLLWLLIIIFMNIFGALLYFVFSKEFKKNNFNFNKRNKFLTRSSDNKIIGGVCSGIAEHFSFDPAIIRILWVIFTIFVNGIGILLYIIFWIAIPSDKDLNKSKKTKEKNEKEKDEKEKNEKSISSKQIKSNKKKSNVLAIFLTLSVFLLLFIFVAGFVFLSNLKYNNSIEQVSVKSLIVDVRSEIDEKIVIDEIKGSHNYKNFNGHNIVLLDIVEPEDDSCTIFERDPYGIKIYDSGCREFNHRFFVDSQSIKGYDVKTLVSGGRLLKMTFTSFSDLYGVSSEKNNETIHLNPCSSEYDDVDFCIEIYEPVCGYNNLGEKVEFSNSCFACLDSEIEFYIDGECR